MALYARAASPKKAHVVQLKVRTICTKGRDWILNSETAVGSSGGPDQTDVVPLSPVYGLRSMIEQWINAQCSMV